VLFFENLIGNTKRYLERKIQKRLKVEKSK